MILAFGAFYYRRTHSNARAILSSTLRHPSTFHLSRNHRYGWQRKRERFALLPAQDGSVEMQEFRRKQLAFSSYESCSLQDVPTSIFVSVPMSSRKKTLCFGELINMLNVSLKALLILDFKFFHFIQVSAPSSS